MFIQFKEIGLNQKEGKGSAMKKKRLQKKKLKEKSAKILNAMEKEA
ncbi:hypothetical protein [Pinibacter soli]|uniref:Uncharacterized protein n=1 Tax=Pinibacter soli TaxID=3044211 RepID=A0ABT6RDH2_9BACT|nr:hypothetical protein [Pinibacter soli]MDI3319919.1 hypothetical protein [Pinibacter soli]